MKRVRCAIYTRKSSEEGLEQDFNSLDAQREACAAYVLSQASEGWTLLPEPYDDGGISGGTLARPALQRLLADVAAGAVDIIVVYKVDRLTRSLLDFSKLVEAFDKAEVSFVSVTQSFNTTTSMGRLTLNMLLSFAQFEREVTAERIRDKLAASKAKGMWMGGTPPLGYRPDGRTLAIVDDHAGVIRDIYRDYLALGSVHRLEDKLIAERRLVPVRTRGNGRAMGGGRFSRGQLYSILKSPIYVGDIPHKEKIYPGLHEALIARDTWDQVQAMLASHVQGTRERTRSQHRSLLAGLIVDGAGYPMQAHHAVKGTVRYRYYVSRGLLEGNRDQGNGLRVPAREIELLVKEQVARLFDDPIDLASRLSVETSSAMLRQMAASCGDIANQLRDRNGGPLTDLVTQVRVLSGQIEIDLSGSRIAGVLKAEAASGGEAITLTAPYRLTRTGRALRLISDDGSRAASAVDPALVNLLAKARRWWGILAQGQIDITALAAREGITDSYITRVVRLAFLSPMLVEAIMAGRQRGDLDAKVLRNAGTLPLLWEKQHQRYA